MINEKANVGDIDKANNSPSIILENMFDSTLDNVSESLKNSFHQLPINEKQELVNSIVNSLDEDSEATKILSDLAYEFSGMLAKHKKGNKQTDLALYHEDEQLTVGKVLKVYTGVKSENTIKTRVRTNKLIGYMDDGVMKLPAWQFHKGQVLPDLEKLLSHISVNGIPAVRALETPMADFNNKKGYEFLRDSDFASALEIVNLMTGKG